MRFYEVQHRFYAGIDLHARTMHLCVLDSNGTVMIVRDGQPRVYRWGPHQDLIIDNGSSEDAERRYWQDQHHDTRPVYGLTDDPAA